MVVVLTCIYTAKYLVPNNAPPVEGGALFVRGDRIAAVGQLSDLVSRFPGVEVVDFEESLLVPLLVNAHTHLELTDFPQWAGDADEETLPDSFVEWILQLIRLKMNLQENDYRSSLKSGIEASIAAGTGAVGDILARHSARDIYQNSPMLGTIFLESLGQDPAKNCQSKNNLKQVLTEKSSGMLELGISPHSPYTISKDYLQSLYRYNQNMQLRCSTHLAESADEVDFVEHSRGPLVNKLYPFVGWLDFVPHPSGVRPVEYLQQQGGLFPENLLVHGVHLSTSEIELLASKTMSLALCPRSNARLKVGKAPAGQLLRSGVKLSLGTDSLASCDNLSIWDEMAFAHRWFEGELDAPTLFSMATQGGAEALAIDSDMGSFDVGKVAAFQILRPKTTVAVDEVFDYLVSSNCSSDIYQVYHHGQLQFSQSGYSEPAG